MALEQEWRILWEKERGQLRVIRCGEASAAHAEQPAATHTYVVGCLHARAMKGGAAAPTRKASTPGDGGKAAAPFNVVADKGVRAGGLCGSWQG